MPGQTEEWKDRGKNRWNDEQALFQRTLPATAGGSKIFFFTTSGKKIAIAEIVP